MSAAAAAAGMPRQQPPQQQEEEEVADDAAAVFAAKHAELLREARAVAREHGVTVRAVVFRAGGADAHELVVGVGRDERRLRGVVERAVERDVAAMGPRQVDAHHRQLLALRAVVLRELQARKKKAAVEEVVGKDEDDGAAAAAAGGKTKTKRAPVKKEVDGDGSAAKSRRTEY